jgi:hypothetical protein
LYGDDARIFLLSCLIREIDFADVKSHTGKDAPKVDHARTSTVFFVLFFYPQLFVAAVRVDLTPQPRDRASQSTRGLCDHHVSCIR